jgi:hypothetical protein
MKKPSSLEHTFHSPFDGMGYGALYFIGILFFGTGMFAAIIGFTDHGLFTELFGSIACVTGIVVVVKAYNRHQAYNKKRRRRKLA